MPIRYHCSSCQQRFSISSRMAGQAVACPACGVETIVPFEESVAATHEAEDAHSAVESSEDEQAESSSEVPAEFSESDSSSPHDAPVPLESANPDTDLMDEGLVLRRPETDFDEMDLTPMVDVTFLLLIFFMITASFSIQKAIPFPPPDPDKQGATQAVQTLDDLLGESIKVHIDQQNAIYIDDEKLADPTELIDTIGEKMRTELKTELVLIVDARALHETVVTVIDAATEVGMQKVRLVDSAAGS